MGKVCEKNMKKNAKIREFETKIAENLVIQKLRIAEKVDEHIKSFDAIELTSFTNENPFVGDFKNKIFFTYNNHYRANSGIRMSIGHLTHPYTSYEDRGYIKGVVTDLEGYLKLRSAQNLSHNFDAVSFFSKPKFRKSKHGVEYSEYCDKLYRSCISELNQLCSDYVKKMSEVLREKTGCSLLYYIREI